LVCFVGLEMLIVNPHDKTFLPQGFGQLLTPKIAVEEEYADFPVTEQTPLSRIWEFRDATMPASW
jgi:hypothetical protein